MVIHSSHDSIWLEFDFSDDTTNTKVSSPRRLAERPGLQPLLKKSEFSQEQAPKEAEERDDGTRERDECPQPAFWGSYHLNWEKLDDSKSNDKKAKLPGSPKNRLALPVAEQLSAGPTKWRTLQASRKGEHCHVRSSFFMVCIIWGIGPKMPLLFYRFFFF